MTLSSSQLDELEELAKKATPGPWRGGMMGLITKTNGEPVVSANRLADKDSAFIAAANPTVVLEMIAEIREGRK